MSEKFRLGVGIILVNQERKVFVGRRIDTEPAAWQMPQGGIELGESASEAARRELAEEIGTDKFVVLKESAAWYSYRLPPEVAVRIWQGQYVGQKQKWFLCKFTGQDADINISTHTPEFNAWKWIDYPQLPEVIVGFKKELYTRLIADFTSAINAV